MKIEINCETGEVLEIPVTEQDILEGKTLSEPSPEEKKKEFDKKALLERLGLTQEEVKLLLS
jgi:hypothetical protein